MPPIPATGLRGVQLREAVADLRAIIYMVRSAIEARLNASNIPGASPVWFGLEAVYTDRAIIERDGRYFSFPYTINAANQVELGEPSEVVEKYEPIAAAGVIPSPPVPLPAGEGSFMEAVGAADSGRWMIRVMRAGLSANGNIYPDAVLREAAALFDGARVFEKSDEQHVKGQGKAFSQLIGGLSAARFVEGKTPDGGELRAVLTLIEPAGDVAVKLREAAARGLSGLFGFSIDADGVAKTQMREGRKIRVATRISKVNSVDLIVEPSAGGELIRMVESVTQQEGDMLREKMLQEIQGKAPAAYQKINGDTPDETVMAVWREAVATAPVHAPSAALGEVEQRIRMIEARANARAAISGCNLPQPARDRLTADFDGRASFVEADVAAAIEAERGYLAKFTESGHVAGLDFGTGARAEDRGVKMADMLDAFFDPAHKDHREVRSFKEAYIEVTGDRRVTGRVEDCDRAKLREATGFREALDSTSFANVLGNSLTRRMVADYRAPSVYDVWRQLTGSPVPINDFRTQERVRYGGYGDLPAVAQGASYAALTSPTDVKATYAVSKRGGLESVTLEMIKNDDVGVIRQIPTKLSRAAKRTLGKFVMDFLRTNPAIYDGAALFHASHGNLGSAALDAVSYAAARLAMMAQQERDSNDPIGIGPRDLWVPAALEEAASNIFKRSTNLDETFVQTLKPNIIPVWYWTDANDWCASADPLDIPSVEIGFLDGNEEPELFVQDNPSVGSMFSNDKLTWKLRHIYGGVVTDYRGLYKAVVE